MASTSGRKLIFRPIAAVLQYGYAQSHPSLGGWSTPSRGGRLTPAILIQPSTLPKPPIGPPRRVKNAGTLHTSRYCFSAARFHTLSHYLLYLLATSPVLPISVSCHRRPDVYLFPHTFVFCSSLPQDWLLSGICHTIIPFNHHLPLVTTSKKLFQHVFPAISSSAKETKAYQSQTSCSAIKP